MEDENQHQQPEEECFQPEPEHEEEHSMDDISAEMGDGEDYAWKSATLLKITQARICDMRELVDRKNRVKHEDDIWWESRNPKQYEKSPSKYSDVQSRLNRSTTAYERSRRPKASLNNSEPPSFCFGGGPLSKKASPEKALPAKPSTNSPKTIKPIGHDSHLLKPTTESYQSGWHGKSDQLSVDKPQRTGLHLVAKIKGTGPKEVNSRLSLETTSAASHKWKSKEELVAQDKEDKKPSTKVQGTSEKLLKPTVAMKHHQTTKRGKKEKDAREEGWNVFGITKDTAIPEVDLGLPYRRTPNKYDSGGRSSASPETDTTFDTTNSAEASDLHDSEEVVEATPEVDAEVEEEVEAEVEAAVEAEVEVGEESEVEVEKEVEAEAEAKVCGF